MIRPTPVAERTRTTLTPPEIAGSYGCKIDKVLGWIKSGELRAINIAIDPNSERPRYRVYPEDLAEFEARRATAPTTPKSTRKRRPPRQEAGSYARY